MSQVEWQAVGICAVLFIGSATAAWRLAGLRGDVVDRWSDRVDLARSGLSERATSVLRSLQASITELFGSGESFDPLAVIADPGAVKAQAKDFLKLIRLREGATARYRLLLWVGPALLLFVCIFAFGTLALGGHYWGLVEGRWLRHVGWWAAGVGGLLAVLGFLGYAYLQHYLATAEIASRSKAET